MILFLIVHQPYTERGLKSLPKGSWCSTTFVGGKLDLPLIEKLYKVCYNVLTCTKICENNVNPYNNKTLLNNNRTLLNNNKTLLKTTKHY